MKKSLGYRKLNLSRAKRRVPLKRLVFEPLDPSRSLPADHKWYVLTTEPHREHHVAHWLEDRGWFTLCPLETRWKLLDKKRGGHKARRTRYQVPLVPKIVICGFDKRIAPPWLSVMDHFFITGVLGISGVPTPMRKGEIERLHKASDGLRRSADPKPLIIGAEARLIAPGAFQGHIVEIASITGRYAKVVQSWFGTKHEVTVALEDMAAA